MASQHCLASFWRQKNIKISWDLGKKNQSAFYNESGSESSPRFITYRGWAQGHGAQETIYVFAAEIHSIVLSLMMGIFMARGDGIAGKKRLPSTNYSSWIWSLCGKRPGIHWPFGCVLMNATRKLNPLKQSTVFYCVIPPLQCPHIQHRARGEKKGLHEKDCILKEN